MWPQIGDAVEVRGMERLTDTCIQERWLPATVCHISDDQIGVAFADGERMALRRNSGQGLYRKPLPPPPARTMESE
jgi:hypothetical protein